MTNNSITAITYSEDIRYCTFIMVGDDYRLCGFSIDLQDICITQINSILALLISALKDKTGKICIVRDENMVIFKTPSYVIQSLPNLFVPICGFT